MKKIRVYSATIAVALFCVMNLHCFGKKTVFGTRSQGLDAVRELTGWQQVIYRYDQDRNYGTLAMVAEYNRSFRPQDIADFLFGSKCLRFSGSRAERKGGDILAD